MKNYILHIKLFILVFITITATSCGTTNTAKNKCSENPNESRTISSITCHFDYMKPRINTIYTRSLRKSPDAQGIINLKLFINKDGVVNDLVIINNNTGNRTLALKIRSLIKDRNFGLSKNSMTIIYPINFVRQKK